MSSGELHIDLRERVTNSIAFIDEAIVNANAPEKYRGKNAEENQ